MKYIRTKDGQLLDVSKCLDSRPTQYDLLRFAKSRLNNKQITISIKNIIKQADTIEELCDELVIHNPSNDGDFYPKHFVYKNRWETMLKPMSDYQKSKGIEIYGAIWTDKGLIYVAKMNEKGEFELL